MPRSTGSFISISTTNELSTNHRIEIEAASLDGNNGSIDMSSVTQTLIGSERRQSRASYYAGVIRRYGEMMLALNNELLQAIASYDGKRRSRTTAVITNGQVCLHIAFALD